MKTKTFNVRRPPFHVWLLLKTEAAKEGISMENALHRALAVGLTTKEWSQKGLDTIDRLEAEEG